MLYVAWKRGLHRKFAHFVPFHPIKKRTFNLLCALDIFFQNVGSKLCFRLICTTVEFKIIHPLMFIHLTIVLRTFPGHCRPYRSKCGEWIMRLSLSHHPQANCARRRQGQKVTCFAAVWIIINIAVQLWRLGGTVDGLDAHISKSGGVSFWCLTDREVNVAERLRLDSLLPTACHYRVVPKGLLIFLGSLYIEL